MKNQTVTYDVISTVKKLIFELSYASLSKRGPLHSHSDENELNLHVNEILFPYERMNTKSRFEKEAKVNSEMIFI